MTLRLRLLLPLVTLLLTAVPAARAQQTATARVQAPTFGPQDTIPFDPAVKTGTLSNGLKYYVRRNGRPANRVLLRLAVKTGSLDEADDQQGLAHMVEHLSYRATLGTSSAPAVARRAADPQAG